MIQSPNRILIIQTAFIGDVILTTSLVEKLSSFFPEAKIDFLVRKGSEVLLSNNPKINKVLVLNKKRKYRDSVRLIRELRKEKYNLLINAQRHFTTGLISTFSGAEYKIGFSSNPMSSFFDEKHPFRIEKDIKTHEVDRLHVLIAGLTDRNPGDPKLYPGKEAEEKVLPLVNAPFITIHPGSVWATKQLPSEKWVELIDKTPLDYNIYLLGGPGEKDLCDQIINAAKRENVLNKAGGVNLIETAALMKHAVVNYVNDSAPLHICTAVNAPCVAAFCSTIPEFGFFPRSTHSKVVQIKSELSCRPCGVHGKRKCPEGHFRCGLEIEVGDLQEISFQ